jgi:hypothetical protein
VFDALADAALAAYERLIGRRRPANWPGSPQSSHERIDPDDVVLAALLRSTPGKATTSHCLPSCSRACRSRLDPVERSTSASRWSAEAKVSRLRMLSQGSVTILRWERSEGTGEDSGSG